MAKKRRQSNTRKTRSHKSTPQSMPQKGEDATAVSDNRKQKLQHISTIVGIVLTLIGLITLIELYPRLSAASQPPYDSRDLVPTFAVTNDGYLPLSDVLFACYIWKTSFNTKHLALDDVSISPVGKVSSFKPTDPITLPCKLKMTIPTKLVQSMDIGIIAQFRIWPTPFRSIKVFRFIGTNDGEKIIWRKQPPNEMLPAIKHMMERSPLE